MSIGKSLIYIPIAEGRSAKFRFLIVAAGVPFFLLSVLGAHADGEPWRIEIKMA